MIDMWNPNGKLLWFWDFLVQSTRADILIKKNLEELSNHESKQWDGPEDASGKQRMFGFLSWWKSLKRQRIPFWISYMTLISWKKNFRQHTLQLLTV